MAERQSFSEENMNKMKKTVLVITILALLCSAFFAIAVTAAALPTVEEGRQKLEDYREAPSKQTLEEALEYIWNLSSSVNGYRDLRKDLETEQINYTIALLEDCAKITTAIPGENATAEEIENYTAKLAEKKAAFRAAEYTVADGVYGNGDGVYLPLYNDKTGYHERYKEICNHLSKAAVAIAGLCRTIEDGKETYFKKASLYFQNADNTQSVSYNQIKNALSDENFKLAEIKIEEIKNADAQGKADGFENILTHLENYPLDVKHAKYSEVIKSLARLAVSVCETETTAEGKQTMLNCASEFISLVPPADVDLAAIKASFNAENLALVKLYTDSLATANGIGAKQSIITNAYNQYSVYPLDRNTEGYDDIMSAIAEAAMDVAMSYLVSVESVDTLIDMTGSIKLLQSFLKKFDDNTGFFKATDGYSDSTDGAGDGFKSRYDRAVANYERLVQEAKDRVELFVPLTEYGATTYLWQHDFDSNSGSKLTEGGTKMVGDYQAIESGADANNPANKYLVIHNDTIGTSAQHYQLKMALTPADKVVYEFDITTFNNLSSGGLHFRSYSMSSNSGARMNAQLFEMDNAGNFYCGNAKSGGKNAHEGPCGANIITTGEWSHVALSFDPTTCDVTFYLNYQKMCTHHATTSASSDNEIFQYSTLYFGTSSSQKTGSVAFDNFFVYYGSAPRTINRLDNLTEYERYKLASDVLSYEAPEGEETPDAYIKAAAWEYAAKLHAKFYNADKEGDDRYIIPTEILGLPLGEERDAKIAEFKAAADAYENFDYEEAMVGYRMATLVRYMQFIDELEAIDRNPDTLEKRRAKISDIEQYLVSRHNQIAEGDKVIDTTKVFPEGTAEEAKLITQLELCQKRIQIQKTYIENEDAILSFNSIMQVFEGSTDANSKLNYYAQAEEIADTLEIALLDLVYEDGANKGKYKYQNFKNAWELYLGAMDKVEEAIRIKNTKDIIGYFAQIEDFDTEAEWLENYGSIRAYVELIRPLIRSGRYTLGIEGYDLAPVLEAFEKVDNWFFLELQKEHIAFIEEGLANFLLADSYVEKMGICRLIQNYIDEADLDANNAELQLLVDRFNIYKDEAEVQEGDYGKLLDQNTVYFVNLARAIDTCVGYSARKAAFERATAYYYSMNVGSEEAQAAILIYESVGRELALIESSSESLMAAVAEYNTAKNADEKYAALVKCYYYSQFVDTEYEGVSIALEAYEAAYKEYNAVIEAANNDVANSAAVVASSRGGSGFSAIVMSIINKIFG